MIETCRVSFLSCLSCVIVTVLVVAGSSEIRRDSQLVDPELQRVESIRVERYHKRNYSFPLEAYVPNTVGWRRLMEERFAQVEEMEDPEHRYEGYIQTLHSALLVPNFTQHGFGLARCPGNLLNDLQKGIREGLPTAREEMRSRAIPAPEPPLFIDNPDLTQRVLNELQSSAEAWSGVQLTPYRAYGFRLYRNESSLYMHLDKMETHVISFILHIDSSDDAEPWPLFIEDFHGRTHQVILTPGDILFYESSKCMHGRPRRFNGSWYSSIFAHYYPKFGWTERNHLFESHCAVPPHWVQEPPLIAEHQRRHQRLEMIGTAMREPDCADNWCRAQHSIPWGGPGEHGAVIPPAFEKEPFHPPGTDDAEVRSLESQ